MDQLLSCQNGCGAPWTNNGYRNCMTACGRASDTCRAAIPAVPSQSPPTPGTPEFAEWQGNQAPAGARALGGDTPDTPPTPGTPEFAEWQAKRPRTDVGTRLPDQASLSHPVPPAYGGSSRPSQQPDTPPYDPRTATFDAGKLSPTEQEARRRNEEAIAARMQRPMSGAAISGTWRSTSKTRCGITVTFVLQIRTNADGAISGTFAFEDTIQNQDVSNCADLDEQRGSRYVEPLVNASFDGRSVRFAVRYLNRLVSIQLQVVNDTLVMSSLGERPAVFRRVK
jgi:hypothetical protein